MTMGVVVVLTTLTSAEQFTVTFTGPEVLLLEFVSPSALTVAVLLMAKTGLQVHEIGPRVLSRLVCPVAAPTT